MKTILLSLFMLLLFGKPISGQIFEMGKTVAEIKEIYGKPDKWLVNNEDISTATYQNESNVNSGKPWEVIFNFYKNMSYSAKATWIGDGCGATLKNMRYICKKLGGKFTENTSNTFYCVIQNKLRVGAVRKIDKNGDFVLEIAYKLGTGK